jgi:hypothetical protein
MVPFMPGYYICPEDGRLAIADHRMVSVVTDLAI